MKKKFITILFIYMMIPIRIFAYSNRVVVGGETIGIEVHSDGVYVVGFYDVDGKRIAEDAGFQIGDVIKKIDEISILDVESLNHYLNDEKTYFFSILRNREEKVIPLKIKKDGNLLKTGLYVRDEINGIGTLSYIDPESRVYGSLGHDIIESNSLSHFLLKNGTIYKAEVSSIHKSKDGVTGEKNAIIDKNTYIGNIDKNKIDGIYGIYTNDFSNRETLEVGLKRDIKKGEASIRTVLNDDKVDDFEIQIISIDEADKTKNIFFEITDSQFLKEAGGIVQGMSGSPIIQNDKIIGAVNYVIVDDIKKGYGVFIETMLEEGDKINS